MGKNTSRHNRKVTVYGDHPELNTPKERELLRRHFGPQGNIGFRRTDPFDRESLSLKTEIELVQLAIKEMENAEKSTTIEKPLHLNNVRQCLEVAVYTHDSFAAKIRLILLLNNYQETLIRDRNDMKELLLLAIEVHDISSQSQDPKITCCKTIAEGTVKSIYNSLRELKAHISFLKEMPDDYKRRILSIALGQQPQEPIRTTQTRTANSFNQVVVLAPG